MSTDLRQHGSRDATMMVGARMLESHLADVTVIRLDDVGDEVFIEDLDCVLGVGSGCRR
jgi:hypothetical protein